MSESTCVIDVLEEEPDRIFTPQEIAQITGIKTNTVNKILIRMAAFGRGSGPVRKLSHGYYQYDPDKHNSLQNLLSHTGTFGIENLHFVRIPPTPSDRTTMEHLDLPAPEPDHWNTPSPFKGYPRHLSTGQEIRREAWDNGTEHLAFISHGRPFSPDLILYLLDQLRAEGLKANEWVRTSIEVNVDGRNITLTPESVTLQETSGIVFKAYNHGQQARYEVADRRKVSLADSLTFLTGMADLADINKVLRQMERMEKDLKALQKQSRMALNIAGQAHEKAIDFREFSSRPKTRKPELLRFSTAAELKAEG